MPKLPKLVIPKFNGDVKRFRSFWDSFDSAINKNPSLSAVDKFNYLHILLEGSAARSIQGLALLETNYPAAIDIIQDRFGNPHQIIAAHMEEFMKLPECNSDKASQFRLIYDKINVNIRGLESLGMKSEQYGSFLIPVIMSKLPLDVRLQIARVTTENVWEIEELLKVIKQEVVARELSDAIKVNEKTTVNSGKKAFPPTAAAQVAKDHTPKQIRCAYCKEEHYSASCVKYSTPEVCREILMEKANVSCVWEQVTVLVSVQVSEDAVTGIDVTTSLSVLHQHLEKSPSYLPQQRLHKLQQQEHEEASYCRLQEHLHIHQTQNYCQ